MPTSLAPDPDHPERTGWALSRDHAREIQLRLRARLRTEPPPDFAPRLVAGADVSMTRFSTVGYAAVVVLDAATLEPVAQASAVEELPMPYVPGYLSFRELPPLAAAWERLDVRPDVVVFDGNAECPVVFPPAVAA